MILIKASLLVMMFMYIKPDETVKPYVSSYIEEHKYLAIDEMIESGIPASITIAQAIIESNAGASSLARETNNHFGIKCKDYWDGASYYYPDDDKDQKGKLIPSCFRKYDSVPESYRDHSLFLNQTDHYKPLFAYDRTDYQLWARGLEACGYATQEGYADKLIRIIELYNLHELDYYTIQYVDRASLSPK
jgi:flagellum-specific peptidoglycan hydrolase FlgJ